MTTIITRRSPTPSRGARNSPTEKSRIPIRRRRLTAVVHDDVAAGGVALHDDCGGATTRVFPEINEEDDALTVALKLGSAGIATVATAPGRSRIPSSVDRDWTHASTTNSHELVARHAGRNYGLGIHVGKSRLYVFDVDHPEKLPPVMVEAFKRDNPPFQSTRSNDGDHGHYFYQMPDGLTLGNGTGTLGGEWGEGRGQNGFVAFTPSHHEKAAEGGCYKMGRGGPIPLLEGELLDVLRTATVNANAATDEQVRSFLAVHSADRRPGALAPIIAHYTDAVKRGEARHPMMVHCVTWGCREATEGLFPAQRMHDQLRAAHTAALADRSHPNGPDPDRGDFPGAFAWAVAQVTSDSVRPETVVGQAAPPEAAALDAVKQQENAGAPTWGCVDLAAILAGDIVQAEPTLFTRDDGQSLLYPGLTHSFHGESESGKSLILQAEAARQVSLGNRVLYIDFESDAVSVVGRLRTFGCTQADIATHFHYRRPEARPEWGIELPAWNEMLDQTYALAVIDGVTEGLGLFGYATVDNDDIAKWLGAVPNQIAARTGAAVVLVDHVTKNPQDRGRHAIGAQSKMAGLTGAAYVVDVVEHLGRGCVGVVKLSIAKDRPGAVRQHCGAFRKRDRTQVAAMITVDSTGDGPTVVTVTATSDHDTAPADFRPTGLMERASEVVEQGQRPGQRELVRMIGGNKPWAERAIEALTKEGHIRVEKKGTKHEHISVKPYRQADDPSSDHYSRGGDDQ